MKNTYFVTGLVLALSFGMGCSKKGPSSASSKDANGSNGSGVNGKNGGISSSDANGSNSDGSSTDLSKLPIIYFDYDQAGLNDEGRTLLQGVATAAKGKKSLKITIEGHCDERGSNEYNLALGERRSQSVKSYLQKLGVSSDHLSAISYGEERPATSGSGDSTWSKNRRAELVITK